MYDAVDRIELRFNIRKYFDDDYRWLHLIVRSMAVVWAHSVLPIDWFSKQWRD